MTLRRYTKPDVDRYFLSPYVRKHHTEEGEILFNTLFSTKVVLLGSSERIDPIMEELKAGVDQRDLQELATSMGTSVRILMTNGMIE